MSSPPPTKTVLFDLDNTLFDHSHSLHSALSATQASFPILSLLNLDHLINKYNAALQHSYDAYLRKEVTYEEANLIKVRTFFSSLGLPEPSPSEAKNFRTIYKAAYAHHRRANEGSVETLAQLRERGFRIAIITNGQIVEQEAKAEAIGVRDFVEKIFTSEGVGWCKPDRRIFDFAVMELRGEKGGEGEVYMVGDSPEADIKGALNAGLRPILYSPTTQEPTVCLFGEEVHVVSHMRQLLKHLGINDNDY
jgi:HAD superfamily hydrolase (TIGR01549 family)